MKKPKTDLRLNVANRSEFAENVIGQQFKERIQANISAIEDIGQMLIDKYWDAFGYNLPWAKDNAHVLPKLKAFNVVVDGVTHAFDCEEPTPVPYPVFGDQRGHYKNVITDELQTDIDTVVENDAQLKMELGEARNRLKEFLAQFTTPAKVAEVSPDLVKYMPEDWLEEVEATTVSLTDILTTSKAA